MPIEKEKFRLYELDEKKRQDVVSIKLNSKERALLEKNKAILQQEKDATAIKQLIGIAHKVIHHSSEGQFMIYVLDNIRKNKRLGIEQVEANYVTKV